MSMDDDDGVQIFFQLFSLVIKTKVVQNVSRMSERQKNMQTDRRTDRKTDRKTKRLFSLVIKTKVFQNVNRMSKIQSDRQEDIQFARQTDRLRDRMTVWQIAGQLKSPLLLTYKTSPAKDFKHLMSTAEMGKGELGDNGSLIIIFNSFSM